MKPWRWNPNIGKNFRCKQWTFYHSLLFIYINVFGPRLIIPLQCDVIPTTNFCYFLSYFCGNETPAQSQIKLII